MVSLEKRGRRVGGWDHGLTIETWRRTVLLQCVHGKVGDCYDRVSPGDPTNACLILVSSQEDCVS